MGPLDIVTVDDLARRMGFAEPLEYPSSSRQKHLIDWKMEIDDSAIFRYLYRNFRPRRHLEFGTWRGTGTLYCLEECSATVWTLNIPDGEVAIDGTRTYECDSGAFIGEFYRQKKLGNRFFSATDREPFARRSCSNRTWIRGFAISNEEQSDV